MACALIRKKTVEVVLTSERQHETSCTVGTI